MMRNAVILVLAEILVGLDRSYTDGTMLTTGSPFVLQVWLMEHLGHFIHSACLCNPLPYDRLEVYHNFDSTNDWLVWLRGLSTGDIR